MFKFLTYIIYFYSLSVMADMSDDTCQDFRIEKKTNKYFMFKQDERYIYVKPIRNGENPEKSLDGFARINATLTATKSSNSYTVPKHVNKLLVMISKTDLKDFNSWQVMPKTSTKKTKRIKRGTPLLGTFDITDELEMKASTNINKEFFCTLSIVD